MPIVGFFCPALASAVLCISSLGTPAADRYHRSIDPATTATAVRDGIAWGLYVDDQTPNRCAVVSSDRARGWHRVIFGVAAGSSRGCPGAINAQEFYPYDCRYFPGAWGPFPNSTVVILQRRFAWPGCHPPSFSQRARLWREAVAHRVALVLWF